MKTILANTGIQTAMLAVALGILLTYIGNEEGSVLIGAAALYIVGKLQKRPVTISAGENATIYDEV